MGRNDKTIKTYGRHRNRVVRADVWSSGEECKNNVFSLSCSSNSLSFNSRSLNSTDESNTSVFTNRQTRQVAKTRKNDKENKPVRSTRQMVLQKNFERDSCSSIGSTGSDILFKSSDRGQRSLKDNNRSNDTERKVLRDTKNIRKDKSHEKQIKRKREPKSSQKFSNGKNEISKYNFSDFDDYSLVISGSPVIGQTAIETSTPCAKRTRSNFISQMSDNNISHIELTESPLVSQTNNDHSTGSRSRSDIDKLGLSSIDASPSLVLSGTNTPSPSNSYHSNQSNCSPSNASTDIDKLKESFKSLSSSNKAGRRNKVESPQSDCAIQVEKLRLSMIDMHVSKRRPSRSKQSEIFDGSDSLFSSLDSDKSSNSKYFSAGDENVSSDESKISDFVCDDEESDDEDDDDNEDLSAIIEEGDEEETQHKHDKNETTLYILVGAESENDSSNDDDDCSDVLEEEEDENADDNSNYCTAESETDDKLSPEHQNHYHLRNKHQDLNESIFEMLTPKKVAEQEVQSSPRSKVLQACQENDFVSFEDCISSSMMKNCKKVGEGVYGEVFRTQNRNKSVALKIIPIEGSFTVNDEAQKTFTEILPEIVISKELSSLRNTKTCYTSNFCRVNSVYCVQGQYPDILLKEWDLFHKTKGSENDRPDMFDENQLFILFEFDDGGRDLESFQFENIHEAKSVFEQVAISLAVAEESLEFEHRDLHWGNVLVKRTSHKTMHYKLLGQEYEVESYGVDVCIIDFTLSRLKKDGCTVYIDLSTDDTLFDGSGDYQFDIYRKMKEENGNKWEPFHSRTNIFWLHYLADKLLRGKRYTQTSREDQALLREFRLFLKDILNYKSACELVVCSEFISS